MVNKQEESFEIIFAICATYAWFLASANEFDTKNHYHLNKFIKQMPIEINISADDFQIAFGDLLQSFYLDYNDGQKRAIARIEPLRFKRNYSVLLAQFAVNVLDHDTYLLEADENLFWELMEILELGTEDIA